MSEIAILHQINDSSRRVLCFCLNLPTKFFRHRTNVAFLLFQILGGIGALATPRNICRTCFNNFDSYGVPDCEVLPYPVYVFADRGNEASYGEEQVAISLFSHPVHNRGQNAVIANARHAEFPVV